MNNIFNLNYSTKIEEKINLFDDLIEELKKIESVTRSHSRVKT